MDVSLHRGINLKALAADTFWSDQFVFGFWYFHEHCYCQNFCYCQILFLPQRYLVAILLQHSVKSGHHSLGLLYLVLNYC